MIINSEAEGAFYGTLLSATSCSPHVIARLQRKEIRRLNGEYSRAEKMLSENCRMSGVCGDEANETTL